MRRLPWHYMPHTAADWRAVGDDYLLPYSFSTVSEGGVCQVAGYATNSPHHLFRPRSDTPICDLWWDDPMTAAGREERAWACYFIAAMLDDEEGTP